MTTNENKYTIQEINEDGNVVIHFEFDNSTQTLINAPTNNKDDLETFLSEYLSAYKAGKVLEETTVAPEVKNLVGKPQTAQEV